MLDKIDFIIISYFMFSTFIGFLLFVIYRNARKESLGEMTAMSLFFGVVYSTVFVFIVEQDGFVSSSFLRWVLAFGVFTLTFYVVLAFQGALNRYIDANQRLHQRNIELETIIKKMKKKQGK